jgi:hypothetical protein
MKHLTDEQIALHCSGDAGDSVEINRHLGECSECRESFEQLKAVLAFIHSAPVPEPHENFEQEMWLKVQGRLPQGQLPQEKPTVRQRLFFLHFTPAKWAGVTAMAVLLLAAFIAGRFWPRGSDQVNPGPSAQIDPQRVVLVAVGDHLERSQMLLIEIMHTDAARGLDLSREQAQARDLLDSNRLYRLSAQEKSDPGVERMLDQLEPVLAEIANAPRDLSRKDLREIQDQVQSQGLLFKIRVISSTIGTKIRQEEPASTQYSGNRRL